jgi:signal transduction histidine kinase
MKNIDLEVLRKARLAILGCKLEGIIHNLNSPLNTIIGYAQILRNKNPELKQLEKIYQAGMTIDSEFKNLALNIEKFNSTKAVLLNINQEINSHLKLMNFNLYYKHHVKVETDLQDNLPKLAIIPGDLHLILDNLINNAIEALNHIEDKTLQLTTELKTDEMIINIKNQGLLQAPPEKVKQPDFTTKENRNYGLGLPLVQFLLAKYKADLLLFSQNNIITAKIIFPIRGYHEK